LKNKPNFAGGEKTLSSIRTRYYEDFMPFVAEKNKANCVSPGIRGKKLRTLRAILIEENKQL
jgi:hypothetical protein